MGIVYLISTILLIVSFMLIKKSDKKLDILSIIGITIVLYFSYNVFLCYILTFIQIPNNLIVLSILNLIVAAIMGIIIYRKKEIQKYKLDKLNLLCVIIILIVTFTASCLNFGLPFNIKYETGDPAVHHITSVVFSQEEKLLNFYKDDAYGVSYGRKIGSYVNSGIIMQCFANVIDEIDYYNIFIAFGIFIFFITTAIMFNILEKYTKTKGGKIIALIVSLIYVLGYPFNSLLFGFEYLSMGILILESILLMVYYFENGEFKFPFYVIIFALLNFELFCSYYMFVPFAYPALWIYFCIYSKRNNKKIFCKKNIILLIITLLVPFLLGYLYHMAPDMYSIFNPDVGANEADKVLENTLNRSSYLSGRGLASYGYIYVNFYSNIILLMPMLIYYLYKKNKEKSFASFDTIQLLFLVLFIILLIIGIIFGKVSPYYTMKNYYALSFIVFYMNFRGLMYLYEKDRKMPFILVIGYIFIILLNLAFTNAPLGKGPFNDNENIFNFVEIYGVNKTIIVDREEDYNLKEIEIMKYAKANLDFENSQIEVMGDSEQLLWGYDLLRYVNYEEFFKTVTYGQFRLAIKAQTAHEKIGKVDYMIYFNRSYYFNQAKDKVFEDGEIIFENEAGGIIKYNK